MVNSQESMIQSTEHLPAHDRLGFFTKCAELACLLIAASLLVTQAWRLISSISVPFVWWLPMAVCGFLAADFASGMVHWAADTWFEESLPVVGRRFLRPFRVHHVNPDDFLLRDFIDTNGDVAMLTIPFLLAVFALPLSSIWGQLLAVFVVCLCAATLPTNQVHQWAHMSQPPRVIGWMQHFRLILRRHDHGRHHMPPYVSNYCIALGWCNPLLTRLDFFRRLERVVTAVTGLQPRADEVAFIREQVLVEEANK